MEIDPQGRLRGGALHPHSDCLNIKTHNCSQPPLLRPHLLDSIISLFFHFLEIFLKMLAAKKNTIFSIMDKSLQTPKNQKSIVSIL